MKIMIDFFLSIMLPLACIVSRFIIHSDNQNPMMQSFEKFDSMLQTFSPHLVIVSGFHMMDNFPFKPGEMW